MGTVVKHYGIAEIVKVVELGDEDLGIKMQVLEMVNQKVVCNND